MCDSDRALTVSCEGAVEAISSLPLLIVVIMQLRQLMSAERIAGRIHSVQFMAAARRFPSIGWNKDRPAQCKKGPVVGEECMER